MVKAFGVENEPEIIEMSAKLDEANVRRLTESDYRLTWRTVTLLAKSLEPSRGEVSVQDNDGERADGAAGGEKNCQGQD